MLLVFLYLGIREICRGTNTVCPGPLSEPAAQLGSTTIPSKGSGGPDARTCWRFHRRRETVLVDILLRICCWTWTAFCKQHSNKISKATDNQISEVNTDNPSLPYLTHITQTPRQQQNPRMHENPCGRSTGESRTSYWLTNITVWSRGRWMSWNIALITKHLQTWLCICAPVGVPKLQGSATM